MSVYIHQNFHAPIFTAVLKDCEETELATGRAGVNIEEGYIEFSSDFVPLYPLGTELVIYRLYGAREIHKFSGQVYLSDTNLIRLIKVVDEPLPNASDVCCTDIALKAAVSIETEEVQSTGFFKKKKKDFLSFPAIITAITAHQVELLIEQETPFSQNQPLFLTNSEPPLFELTPISIRKSFEYGTKITYLCAIEYESEESRENRLSFLKEHQIRQPRIFSP